MQLPARYSENVFTLAYCIGEREAHWSTTRLAAVLLLHRVRYRSESHILAGLDPNTSRPVESESFDALPSALLAARERYGIAVASWELYEPPSGMKLFGKPRTIAERRHSLARRRMQKIRWTYRPSNRLVAALQHEIQRLHAAGENHQANMLAQTWAQYLKGHSQYR